MHPPRAASGSATLGRLGKLPPELREVIYEMVAEYGIARGGEIKIKIQASEDTPGRQIGEQTPFVRQIGKRSWICVRKCLSSSEEPRHQLALTATSRAIRRESLHAMPAVTLSCEIAPTNQTRGGDLRLDINTSLLCSFLERQSPLLGRVKEFHFAVEGHLNHHIVNYLQWDFGHDLRYYASAIKPFLPELSKPIYFRLNMQRDMTTFTKSFFCNKHGFNAEPPEAIEPETPTAHQHYLISISDKAMGKQDIRRVNKDVIAFLHRVSACRPVDTITPGCCDALNAFFVSTIRLELAWLHPAFGAYSS